MKTHSKPICKSHERHSRQNLQIRLLFLPTLNLRTFILIIWTVFGLTYCDSSNRKNSAQSSTTADTIIKTTINPEINQDTFQYANTDLSNNENTTATLLTTGVFPDDELLKKHDKENWFGLFQSNTGYYYLAETKIIIEKAHYPVHYPIYDGEDQKSGLSVKILNKDESIILIAGLGFLKNHKIGNPAIPYNSFSGYSIFPGDTLKFNYLGIDYNIYANSGKEVKGKYQYVFEYYKLYLSANKNGQVITELIVQESNWEGPDDMPTIIFAGDIDNDGFLDLLIGNPEYEGATALLLYLSIIADKGHLIKLVGTGDF